MHRGMSNLRELKLRRYAAHLIGTNDYLDAFPGAKGSIKIGGTEIDEILLKIMTNVCSKQLYLQGFYCETISFQKDINMS